MLRKQFLFTGWVMAWLWLMPAAASADIANLIGSLTSNLGVSQQQAEGGTAAVFNAAKQNLSGDQFSQLTSAIPGLSGLLGQAPSSSAAAGGASSLAGQAGSLLGSGGGALSTASQLAGSFGQLGLSPDMVGKFTDTILGYVKNQGGTDLMQLLQKALI